MRIMVTGGAGFIGSHVTDALVARGHRVLVVDDLSTGSRRNLNPRAQFLKMDIRSPRIAGVFLRFRPDVVYHLAAEKDPRASVLDPVRDAETNIIGLLRVVAASRDIKIKKFIFASTGGAIYGGASRVPTPETYPAHPLSPYGVSKLAAEHYLHSFRHAGGFPSVSLRLANVYGPRQDPKSEAGVVAIWIAAMRRKRPVLIFGDGKQTRDFVYIDDVVRAFLVALGKPVVGIYNIGTGRETSLNALYRAVVKIVGVSVPPVYGPSRLGEERRSAIDPQLAEKALGWKPRTPLEGGLKKTIAWFQKKN